MPARTKIMFIDSCYSEATAPGFKALVPEDVFEEFDGEGVVTITASNGQEKSVEFGGHGAFTYHLLAALEGGGDTNNDGVVELNEVWDYLEEKVQETAAEAGNRQTPVMKGSMEHRIPLTINPAAAAGATLSTLRRLFTDGTITLAEMTEAEDIFRRRGANPRLRQIYRDLAAGTLPENYFRLAAETVREATSEFAATAAAPDALPNAVAASGDQAAYDIAVSVDTEDAWSQYLRDFPDGAHIAEANQRIQQLQVDASDTTDPTSAYVLAQEQGTEEALNDFIQEFPTSPLASVALRELDALKAENRISENALYQLALDEDTEARWEEFINTYPDGRFIGDAMEKRTLSRRRAADEMAHMAAATDDTIDSWENYLAAYPDGVESEAATVRINQLRWAQFADLTYIPGGVFMMGDADGRGEEKPAHSVQVDSIHMGQAEITNAQYRRFLQETGWQAPEAPGFSEDYMDLEPGLPVVNVTYRDAQEFAGWLTGEIGLIARLPTEAEWEYSARAGLHSQDYPWDRGDPRDQARYNNNDPSGIKTVRKDAFVPNAYGLYNMSGNVQEWVADFFDDNYYEVSPTSNPTGPAAGRERVLRGGSWDTGDDQLRVARRERREPRETDDDIGFRIVIEGLAPQGPPQ